MIRFFSNRSGIFLSLFSNLNHDKLNSYTKNILMSLFFTSFASGKTSLWRTATFYCIQNYKLS